MWIAHLEQNRVTAVKILYPKSSYGDSDDILVTRKLRRVKNLVLRRLGLVAKFLNYLYDSELWFLLGDEYHPTYDWTGDRQGNIIQTVRAIRLNPPQPGQDYCVRYRCDPGR